MISQHMLREEKRIYTVYYCRTPGCQHTHTHTFFYFHPRQWIFPGEEEKNKMKNDKKTRSTGHTGLGSRRRAIDRSIISSCPWLLSNYQNYFNRNECRLKGCVSKQKYRAKKAVCVCVCVYVFGRKKCLETGCVWIRSRYFFDWGLRQVKCPEI